MDERQHSRSPITSFNIKNQWYDMPLQVLIFLAVATVPKYGSEADRVDSKHQLRLRLHPWRHDFRLHGADRRYDLFYIPNPFQSTAVLHYRNKSGLSMTCMTPISDSTSSPIILTVPLITTSSVISSVSTRPASVSSLNSVSLIRVPEGMICQQLLTKLPERK